MKVAVVCPNCWLHPDEVEPGQAPPYEIAPGLIDCPKCPGLVRVRDEAPEAEGPKKDPRGLDVETILSLFLEEQKRVDRDGSGGEKSPPKDKPPPSRSRRVEQEPLGFPDRLRSKSETMNPLERPISVQLTKEMDAWLQEAMKFLGANQSDVLRAAISWGVLAKPSLPKGRIKSASRSRRQCLVRLSQKERALLFEEASRLDLKRVGRLVAGYIDHLRRKKILLEG